MRGKTNLKEKYQLQDQEDIGAEQPEQVKEQPKQVQDEV
jgi:hypothetical protein